MSCHKIKIYVVSLKNQLDRRAHIEKQFQQLGLEYNFFDAISKGNAIRVCQDLSLNFVPDSITLGELGCFMSHVSLWQMMINKNIPYLVIFEDDIVLSTRIHNILLKLDMLTQQYDVIKLETMQTPTELGRKIAIDDDLHICSLLSEHMGTAAYVVSNECAVLMMNKLSLTSIDKPIDHLLFKDWLKDFSNHQVFPAVAIQDDLLHSKETALVSNLEKERKQRMGKNTYPSTKRGKVQRELSRLFKQLSPSYWFQKYNLKSKTKGHCIVPFEGKI